MSKHEAVDTSDPRVQNKMHPLHRTELLVGRDAFERLSKASFCVVGLGGVGAYAAESLLRAGAGHMTIVDFDDVCITNLNRQLHATRSTIGQKKAKLMEERLLSIRPKADVRAMDLFYSHETADEILDRPFTAVLDCIDNMTAKVHLLNRCVKTDQRVISAMGAGGRMDPTRIRVSDLSETKIDPFAALVRDLMRKRGVETGIECVWSDEHPMTLDPFVQAGFRCICPNKSANEVHGCEERFQVQGSSPWLPAMYGFHMAAVAVNRFLELPVWDVDRPKPWRQKPAVGKLSAARKKELLAEAGIQR